MHNQWTFCRSAFRLIDSRYRIFVERIGSQAVDGFRWECNQSTLPNNFGRALDLRRQDRLCRRRPLFCQSF